MKYLLSLALVLFVSPTFAETYVNPTLNFKCSGKNQDACKKAVEKALATAKCKTATVDCSAGACVVRSPNCRVAQSDGYSGTQCQQGTKSTLRVGSGGSLNPGWTYGFFGRSPQDICVAKGDQFEAKPEGQPAPQTSPTPNPEKRFASGTIKVVCSHTSGNKENQCREVGERVLKEMNCAVSSVECSPGPQAKTTCGFNSSNCAAASSDGFTGSICQAGDTKNVNFGSNAKLDPGFTLGATDSAPQVLCFSEKPADASKPAPADTPAGK